MKKIFICIVFVLLAYMPTWGQDVRQIYINPTQDTSFFLISFTSTKNNQTSVSFVEFFAVGRPFFSKKGFMETVKGLGYENAVITFILPITEEQHRAYNENR
jgi:hypothetical protein